MDRRYTVRAQPLGTRTELGLYFLSKPYNRPYYWRITAKDGNGGESRSRVFMFITREATPDELIVGKWFVDTLIENGILMNASDCQKNTYFEFDANGMLRIALYGGDPCTVVTSSINPYSLPDATTLLVGDPGDPENYPIILLTETELKIDLGSQQVNFVKKVSASS